MAQDSTLELDYCRELALQPGSLFEFTSQFLKAEALEPLLIIYALTQSICNIPDQPIDDAVKWEKLKWWGEELLADPDSPARHPVLRAMKQSGAREKLDNSLLFSLVGESIGQIDAAPVGDKSALYERFSDIGLTQIRLELALDGAEIVSGNPKTLAAASRLFKVVSSFAPGHRSQTEHIPMSFLAKYGVRAEGLGRSGSSAELIPIFADLVSLCLEWYSTGCNDLLLSSELSPANQVPGLHLRLRWAMERRQLMNVQKNIEKFLKAGMRYGLGDAWFAWRFLRKLT